MILTPDGGTGEGEVSKRRHCLHDLAIHRAFNAAVDEESAWTPRKANHKRFNDTHFEIRAAGKEMLIGPGIMGYVSDDYEGSSSYYYPYEKWNLPENYNLTRALRRYPKSLYRQSSSSPAMAPEEKVRKIRETAGATLYRMQADNLDRYVLWANQRYFVVVDVPRTSSPIYLGSHYHFRATSDAPPTAYRSNGGQTFFAKRFAYEERAADDSWSVTDPAAGLRFFSAFPNSVVTTAVNPEWALDSCADSATRTTRPMATASTAGSITPPWPRRSSFRSSLAEVDGNVPTVTPTVQFTSSSSQTIGRLDLRVRYGSGAASKDQTWVITPSSLADGSVLGP